MKEGKYRLFLLFLKKLPDKKKKYLEFYGFLLILIIPQLIYLQYINTENYNIYSKHPVLYSINDASILKTQNPFISNLEISSNFNHLNSSIVRCMHTHNINIEFCDSISNNFANFTNTISSLFFPIKELAKFITFLTNSNIIELEGELPYDDNEILIDRHFLDALNRTYNIDTSIGQNLNLSYYFDINQKYESNYIVSGIISIKDYSLLNQILSYESIFLNLDPNIQPSKSNNPVKLFQFTPGLLPSPDFLIIGDINLGLLIKEKILQDPVKINFFVYREIIFNPFWLYKNGINSNLIPITHNQILDITNINQFRTDLYQYNVKNNYFFYLDESNGFLDITNQINSVLEIRNLHYILNIILIILFLFYTYLKSNLNQNFLLSEQESFQNFGLTKSSTIIYQILREELLLLSALFVLFTNLIGYYYFLNLFFPNPVFLISFSDFLTNSFILFIDLIIVVGYPICLAIFMMKNSGNKKIKKRKNQLPYKKDKTIYVGYFVFLILLFLPIILPKNYYDKNSLLFQIAELFDSILFLEQFTLIETFLFNYYQKFFFLIIIIIPFFVVLKISPKLWDFILSNYWKILIKKSKLSSLFRNIVSTKSHYFKVMVFVSIITFSYTIGFYTITDIFERNSKEKIKESFGSDLCITEFAYNQSENMENPFGELTTQLSQINGISDVIFVSNSYYFTDAVYSPWNYQNTWKLMTFFDPISYFNMFRSNNIILSSEYTDVGDVFLSMDLNISNVIIGRTLANELNLKIGDQIPIRALIVDYYKDRSNFWEEINSSITLLTIHAIWDFLPGMELFEKMSAYTFINWKFLDTILNNTNLDSKTINTFRNPCMKKYYINVNDSFKTLDNLTQFKTSLYEKFTNQIYSIQINPFYDYNPTYFFLFSKIFCGYFVISLFLFLLLCIKLENKDREFEFDLLKLQGYPKKKINRLFNLERDLRFFVIYIFSSIIGWTITYAEYKFIYFINFWGSEYNPLTLTEKSWNNFYPIEFDFSLIPIIFWFGIGLLLFGHYIFNDSNTKNIEKSE